MAIIDTEKLFDIAARERLLDQAFGPGRRGKTAERLRENRLPAAGLSFVARQGEWLVGTLRFWHVAAGHAAAGDVAALMLGPIAIDARFRSEGIGGQMIRLGLARAAQMGHGGVILVGDAPYYARFGFEAGLTEGLDLPGPVDRARFLGLELRPGALAGAQGLVRPTGAIPLGGWDRGGLRKRAA